MFQIFKTEDAEKYGVYAAIIIDIIYECNEGWSVEDLIRYCPYMSPKKINKLVNMLVTEGVIYPLRMSDGIEYFLVEENA